MASQISVEDQWKEWKDKHGKTYESENEDQKRFGFFKNNLKMIEEHNKKYDAGEVTYTLGINQFTDLGPGEDPCGHHHHH